MTEPELLDVFCCQGGASAGYAAAGFRVTGVDIDPQPRYPYRLHRADALAFLRDRMEWIRRTFKVIHASPPCRRYSRTQIIRGREHPDLVGPTRDLLNEIGLPWVMENVMEAPLRRDLVLCGAMFGLRTYRHRVFEFGGGLAVPAPPPHPEHMAPVAEMGRPVRDGEFMTIVGNFSGADLGREIMGMPWATRDGVREAVPVAYTRFIGEHMMKELGLWP